MADPAVEDLRSIVGLGLARGSALLTAGEQRIAERIGALAGAPASAYARLTARVPSVFALDTLTIPRVSDPVAAVRGLVHAQLADHLVPWSERARHLTRPDLVAALKRLGLPVSGRKADLIARLDGHTRWHRGRWVRIRHRPLVRRLERWAFLRPFPDRATLVIERLGMIRWPAYRLTHGPRLHPDRRALIRWEAALGLEDPEAILAALAAGDGRAPGALDLDRWLRARLRQIARDLEPDDPDAATTLYRRAVVEGGESLARVAFRWSRAAEAAGRPTDALGVLHRARSEADPVQGRAIARAGRRVARALGRSWAPDPPLRVAPERQIRLAMSPEGRRKRWGPKGAPIEAAVCHALARVGRTALHGEGRAFTTLFALLFAETYFLPVYGALPTRMGALVPSRWKSPCRSGGCSRRCPPTPRRPGAPRLRLGPEELYCEQDSLMLGSASVDREELHSIFDMSGRVVIVAGGTRDIGRPRADADL